MLIISHTLDRAVTQEKKKTTLHHQVNKMTGDGRRYSDFRLLSMTKILQNGRTGLCCRSKQISWDNFKRKKLIWKAVKKKPSIQGLHICNLSYLGGWRKMAEFKGGGGSSVPSIVPQKTKTKQSQGSTVSWTQLQLSWGRLLVPYIMNILLLLKVNLEYECKQDFRCVWRKRGGKEEVGGRPQLCGEA